MSAIETIENAMALNSNHGGTIGREHSSDLPSEDQLHSNNGEYTWINSVEDFILLIIQ